MKFIDLDAQTFRQTIVDKEDGVYLGQVSSVMLDDNKTIIAFYPKGHGRGSLVMKKSFDAGITWSERQNLPESFVTSMEVPTVYRTTDADGKKRIVLFSGFYPLRKAVSEDEGNTWTDLEVMGDYAGICAMGDVVALENPGEYMALFHDDKDADHTQKGGSFYEIWRYTEEGKSKYVRKTYNQAEDGGMGECVETALLDGDENIAENNGTMIYKAYFSNMDCGKSLEIKKMYTKDGGLTWSDPMPVISHETAHICEPGTIRLKDGTLAVLMRDNSRLHNSFIMFSSDNGETFEGLREMPKVLTGDRHICRRLSDGRIVVAFRDMLKDGETYGDWVLWVGTDDDLTGGKEGQYKFRLKDNSHPWDCGYSGLHILPDDTIVAITYGRWTEGEKPSILSVRLNLSEFE